MTHTKYTPTPSKKGSSKITRALKKASLPQFATIKEVSLPPAGRLSYKISEGALLLGVSENSIRRLIASGQLKACLKLRHILIPHQAIEEFLGVKEAA